MSPAAKSFLQRWAVTSIAVLMADTLIADIRAESLLILLGASLLLGVLNAFLRPVLLLLSLPLLIVTLGLFTVVINALLLRLVSFLVPPFHVADFWAAVKGALVISIVSFFANLFFGTKEKRVSARISRRDSPRRPPPPGTGSGPVIDV